MRGRVGEGGKFALKSACCSFTHPPAPLGPRGSSRQGRGSQFARLLQEPLLGGVTVVRYLGAALLMVTGTGAISEAGVSLDLTLGRERVYAGEVVPVTVTLRVSDVTVRNVGYPSLAVAGKKVVFDAPDQVQDPKDQSVSLYRFAGSFRYGTSGTLSVGPARLSCEVPEQATGSSAFFGDVELRQHTLTTPSAPLTVLPLPVAGRPATFSGAVGSFTVAVTTRPGRVLVGEPLTISTSIHGSGNAAEAQCPEVSGEHLRSYPATIQRSSDGLACEQVVVPSAAGTLPAVIWSYFDPHEGRFITLRHQLPEAAPSASDSAAAPAPPVAVKPAPAAPAHAPDPPVWLAAACVVVITVVVIQLVRRLTGSGAPHVQTPAGSTAIGELLAKAEHNRNTRNVEDFYNCAFMIVQQIMRDDATANPSDARFPHHEDHPLFERIHLLMEHCDMVRYGKYHLEHDLITQDLKSLRLLTQ